MPSTAEEISQQARTLADIPLYRNLGDEEIAELNQLLKEVTYQPGDVIFYENDPGDAAYIVRAGAVRIWTHDEDAREVTLARLEPFDFFGELAVLDGSPRSASATAIEETTLGRLGKGDLHRFLLAHPQAALVMIQEIGRRLRTTNRIVTKRVTRNINVEMEEKMTVGARVADKVASFGGSWTFILIYCAFLLVWIGVNTFLLARMRGDAQFDPFPYILLNLMLSMTAALQAPIIMMSQNRAQQKDRLAAENDFRVNLKSELMLEELTRRMDRLQNEQLEEVAAAVNKLAAERGEVNNGNAAFPPPPASADDSQGSGAT